MQPAYRRVESRRDPEELWRLLASGDWDWLGIDADGLLLAGSPRTRTTAWVGAASSMGDAGADEGAHGVRVSADPTDPNVATDWFEDEQAARARFSATVERYRSEEGAALLLIERIEADEVVERHLVSRA